MTPTEIHTYVRHRGRLRPRRHEHLRRLLPEYGVPVADGPLDPTTLFGRRAPLVLEIGSGMGDATTAMAAADPGRDYLAAEVHTIGVAHLLGLIEARGLTNLRVAHGDGLVLARDRLAPDSLDAVHVFFPDPWPKLRHHKRRLFQPARVALLRSRLRPGGILHAVTDWAEYARVIQRLLAADPGLVVVPPADLPGPPRPVTKYEQRALAEGRSVFELVARRH